MLAAGFSQTHQSEFPTQSIPVPSECWSGLVIVAFKKSIDGIVRRYRNWMAKWEFHAAQ
jgi:hypothetical protein